MEKRTEIKAGSLPLPLPCLRSLPLFLVLSALWLFFLPVCCASGSPAAEGAKRITILRQGGDPAHFNVEVAEDGPSIRKGLSGREFMPNDRGMLFILGDKRYSFWMKGMRFPIDIVVIGSDAKVMEVIPGNQRCEQCPEIRIPDGAAYVLEINAGLAEKYKITKGDYLEVKTGKEKTR